MLNPGSFLWCCLVLASNPNILLAPIRFCNCCCLVCCLRLQDCNCSPHRTKVQHLRGRECSCTKFWVALLASIFPWFRPPQSSKLKACRCKLLGDQQLEHSELDPESPGSSQNNFRIIVTLRAEATKHTFGDQHLHFAPLRSCWLVMIRVLAVVSARKKGQGCAP